MSPDMSFEVDHSGEDITSELMRAQTPPPRSERRALVRVPPLPGGLELPELAAAAQTLETERARLAETQRDLSLAEAKAKAARQADTVAEVAAYREGKPAPAPSAAAVAVEITKLSTQRALGITAVAQAEAELASVLDKHRAAYLGRVAKAIEADRLAAGMALDGYIAARGRLLATLTVRNWLAGDRKFATGNLGELRGIGQPPPSAEAVLESLKRELVWS
jgi:hypothetical protein